MSDIDDIQNKPEKELARSAFIMAAEIIKISKIKYGDIDYTHEGRNELAIHENPNSLKWARPHLWPHKTA